ncbi:reverse transcriptase family protein [Parasulfitobacter algicola]|uniref:RNA-directed DNA polymerase n=1 Tax=Parasulfitobacter algicola TaxID=2614809 RepID=A0ABX2IUS0_9RHOB|nr:reverse transcriptase family protein [Sulfitobacter algicola]NSX56295.1 RNA-directed DNA polymerase [Sulfitobacter algicola]
MNRANLAQSLAGSLVCCDWTLWAVEHHLTSRLPSGWSKTASNLASELIAAFPAPYVPSQAALVQRLISSDYLTRILDHAMKHDLRFSPILDSARFAPIPAFEGLDIPQMTTLSDLADYLALNTDQLVRFTDLMGLSNGTDNVFAPHYRFHLIAKRNGRQRLIEEPKPVLKSLQRRVFQTILNKVPVHDEAYGFVPGRSCRDAAARHTGEQVVIGFDLRNFFPSVSYGRIYGLFRALGYPDGVAHHLCGLCTIRTPPHIRARMSYDDGRGLEARHLPQGAPTSPALANLVCHRLDCRLSGLAHSLDARFTRYADDLTFSGDRRMANAILKVVPQIVTSEGFALNPTKTRCQGQHGRQVTTGIVVNSHINLPRETYDYLKAVLHHLIQPKDPRRGDPAFLKSLSGQIGWVEQINPGKGAKLREKFDQIIQH